MKLMVWIVIIVLFMHSSKVTWGFWKEKNKLGAFGAAILTLASVIIPYMSYLSQ
ncbi:hypothetical protein GCM10008967_02390 [Bacillus carboniphilus]|uniref:Uncharacterized protein n=1 Tax=Bacillus carboniphilus TaxID=86663 RepID=A0ABP3FG31_9BACI